MNNAARFGFALAAWLALSGCAAAPPRNVHPLGEQPAPAQNATVDPSYDWHGLLLLPFGTLLRDSPRALHEVLLFHDETHSAADGDNRDCHTVDGMPPRFVGHQPDEYLLCFAHDRLTRIQASVRLSADDARPVFARACALWQKSPAPAQADICEGRDGGTAFSGRLDHAPGETGANLVLVLTDAVERDAVAVAPREQ